MKTKFRHVLVALALLALPTFNDQLSIADAQGTAFTYQGRLNDGANPANGGYDLTFSLFATNTSGVAIAGPVTNGATAVSNGLFIVVIDFGPSAFTGGSNWMEIAVRTNGSSSFVTLAPRQQVTPAPYAITAESANTLASLTVQQNTSGGPNMIGGASDNFVSGGVVGATIAGGGATNFPVVGRGGTTYFSYTNSVTASFGTVSGGGRNIASGQYATVGGGDENTASGSAATVGGGTLNTASGQDATAGGGDENTASGNFSTTSGGFGNQAKGLDATVGGGASNVASNQFATVSGGNQNIAGGLYATVGGGYHNYAISNYSTVSGGYKNLASGDTATVAGGTNNTASGVASFAAGANASALHDGSFVWADNSGGTFASIVTNQFSVRAIGGIRLIGNVGINTTNASTPLDVNGNAWVEDYLYVGNFNLGDTGYLQVNGNAYVDTVLTVNGGMNVDCANSGYLWVNGNIQIAGNAYKPGGGSWSNSSDRRLKKNIQPLTGVLDKLLELQGVSYEYKDPEKIHELSGERIGMIAQDVEKVFPDWVSTGDDGYKRLTYRGFEALTVEALRELRAEKDAKIAALEKQNAGIEKELAEQRKTNAQTEARFEQLEKAVARAAEKSNATIALDSEVKDK